MDKKIFLLVFLTFGLNAETDVYQKNCVSCHRYQPATLEKMFMLYLKTYSVKGAFKYSLKGYLMNPTEKNSLIGSSFIKNFSVKDKSDLNETQIDKAIDIYWDLYNPKDNLK